MKLTAASIDALELGGKTDAIFFDDDLHGFGYRLRLGANGKLRRSWVVQYKRTGATRRMSQSAEKLSAEQARGWAKKVLAKVALGEDPQADSRARRDRDSLTMRSQTVEFLAVKQSELAPRTFVEVKRYLTDSRYFGPLHGLPVDAIHRKDIAARTVVIMRERGAPTAARARGALGSFFTWCMRMGLTESNPTIGSVAPAAGDGRKRVLSDAELVAIWKACGADDYGRIIRLLILTACRRAEIGNLAWPELDLERGTFTIPAERSKNGKAHILPLMSMMRAIIDKVPRRATRDQLFGVHSHGYTAWAHGKLALDERSGVTDWTVHDVRRSVASRMGDLGILPHVIEQILNHQSGHKAGPAGIYNKSVYANDVRSALALWEDHVGRGRRAEDFAIAAVGLLMPPLAACSIQSGSPAACCAVGSTDLLVCVLRFLQSG
jgi:integrase